MAPVQRYLYYTKGGTKSTKAYSNLCKKISGSKFISEQGVMLYAWNLSIREAVTGVQGQLGYLGKQCTSGGMEKKDSFKMEIKNPYLFKEPVYRNQTTTITAK